MVIHNSCAKPLSYSLCQTQRLCEHKLYKRFFNLTLDSGRSAGF